MKKEHKTYIKYIHISPKKLRAIVDDVRERKPMEVLNILNYSPRRSSALLSKVIKSSIDGSTKVLGVKPESLFFKEIIIEKGPDLKRYRAGSKGSARPFKRRSSHVKIIMSSDEKAKKMTSVKKTEKKPIENLRKKDKKQ